MRAVSILMCSLALSAGCQAASNGNTTALGEGDALARLRALGAASQCRQTADCATVPVGNKACGGPATYLAVARADLMQAQALSQRYAMQRQQELAKNPGPPSTCDSVPDPGAQCVAGRCVSGRGTGVLPAD